MTLTQYISPLSFLVVQLTYYCSQVEHQKNLIKKSMKDRKKTGHCVCSSANIPSNSYPGAKGEEKHHTTTHVHDTFIPALKSQFAGVIVSALAKQACLLLLK